MRYNKYIFHHWVGGGDGLIEKWILLTWQLRFYYFEEFVGLFSTIFYKEIVIFFDSLLEKSRKTGPIRLSDDMESFLVALILSSVHKKKWGWKLGFLGHIRV